MKKLAFLSLAAALSVGLALAQNSSSYNENHITRVLLISVDGMHAVDFANCANGISTVNNGEPYCPAIAALGKTGVNYVAASTSKPSDSFPGLTAIVTGGSPALTGVYYDVAYSRNSRRPAKTTGNGNAAGPCTAGAAPTGTTTEYEEGIDIDQTKVNGGAPGASLTDGGIASIDPQRLPRDPANGCAPVYPVAIRPRQQHLQRHSRRLADTRHGPTSTRPTPRSPPASARRRSTTSTRLKSTPT